MTDDELKRIEHMADARTVDAEVRAALHRLAADWRDLRYESGKNADAWAEADQRAEAAETERDTLREQVRNYVRERQDAAVLGPDRCGVDRHFTKLEQLV